MINKLGNWVKSIGREGTLAEHMGGPTPFGWGVAKTLVYDNLKKALGLDQVKCFMFGAAPMQPTTREYFLSLNFLLVNVYGMSECAGPQNLEIPKLDGAFNIKSAGTKLPGTQIKIFAPDNQGDGEICFRGRNTLMGDFKDEESTKKTLDEQGFIHSGDVGHLDKHENLEITGRIKELLITAGGENIAPVLIENEVRTVLPFISNIVVVGDQKKFLAALITLKNDIDQLGAPIDILSKEAIDGLKVFGIENVKVIQDVLNNEKFKKIVDEGMEKANLKAISKSHYVRKWALLEKDLSISGEELTPTLKVKRNVIHKKYFGAIEGLYNEPKL